MRKILFIHILITISFNSFAQQILNNSIRDVEHLIATSRSIENNNKYANAKGSPYLTDNFISAKIIPGNKTYWVRYNAYEDVMEVKTNSKIIILDNSQGDYKIIFTSNSNPYVALMEKGKKRRGYFIEVLKTDNISLYKKTEKKYTPKRESLNSYDKDKPAYFSKGKSTYFIQQIDSDLQELPTKQKAFLNLFSNNKTKVKDFIKKNRIKLSRENDLVQLVNFVNSL